MSEEEDESASEGFSASEDEWKPQKDARGGESSDDDDSDFEDLPAGGAAASGPSAGSTCKKRDQKPPSGIKGASVKKRKPSGQSLRSKLYNKYRPPPKTLGSSPQQNSPSASGSKNAKTPNDAHNDSSSESSVDDYLVNPADLDLRSSFFTANKDKSPAPQFDCNAGITNLSDSGSEDNNESSLEDNASKVFDFRGLLENANSLERTRDVLAARRAAGTPPQKGPAATMDVNELLALGENQNYTKDSGEKKTKKKPLQQEEQEEVVVSRRQPPSLEVDGPSRLTKTKSTRIKRHTKTRPVSTAEGLDTDDSDFEEVAEAEGQTQTPNVSGDLEIHIGQTCGRQVSKEQKTQMELEMALKRRLNRDIKDRQILMHKVSLLCLISRSIQYNRLLSETELMPQALKLLPSKNAYPTERGIELKYLQSFVSWFKTAIKLLSTNLYPTQTGQKKEIIMEELINQMKRKEARCKQDMIFIFIVLARGMGMNCRLIVNLQPLPLRPEAKDLIPIKMKVEEKNKSKKKETEEEEEKEEEEEVSPKKKAKIVTKVKAEEQPSTSKAAETKPQLNRLKKPPVETATPVARRTRKASAKPEDEPVYPQDKIGSPIVPKRVISKQNNANPVKKESLAPAKRELRKRSAKSAIPQLDGADDVPKKRPKLEKLNNTNSSPIFEPPKPVKKAPQLPKAVENLRKDRRVLSTDDETIKDKTKPNASDMWLEVWSEVEEQWICIDLFKGKLHCVDTIRRNASPNLAYVFAFQDDLSLKDVTARYCSSWTTTVRKSRVEKAWLDETIAPYLGRRTKRDIREDEQLRRIHSDKPLPKSISEFKDHPLYALERHLLKFQGIYPPDAPTLGFIRGEAVYARDCVHLLHSRDIWLKSARVVKLGEQPYKVVKARPKWDKLTRTVIKDQPLEIFGYWQTQDYEPPTAENGLVPRNAYGNVELFKDCMLPKKTVHLRLPGLMRVCKKLNIDCANAVVGFDFHQGACHPMYDGFIVCEEFEEVVTAAWEEDQQEQARKEQEKYETRVYGNWKKLIKGLLIRERLKKKYNF